MTRRLLGEEHADLHRDEDPSLTLYEQDKLEETLTMEIEELETRAEGRQIYSRGRCER